MNAVLADASQTSCERCHDSGEVWSDSLRLTIACPRCVPFAEVRRIPWDPDALRRLARTERKRLRNRAAVAVLETLVAETRIFPKLPPELVTTDRVLDRWAAYGTGKPAENPDVYSTARPPQLDEDTQVIVSALVRVAHARVQMVTYDLYLMGAPATWVAKKLSMLPRSFGRYHQDVLREHRLRFLASEHSDLISLIRAQP